MKTSAKFLSLLAAMCVAFVGPSRAQLQTYTTVLDYTGNTIILGGSTIGEQFTGVIAVSSLTYNFFAAGVTPATLLNAKFAQYDGSGAKNSLTNWITVQDFGQITIPAFISPNLNGWSTVVTNNAGTLNTFVATFNFPSLQLTSASQTYALLLTNPGSTTQVQIGSVDKSFVGEAAFALGSQLTNTGSDYTFSQMRVVPDGNELPAVPESSTVAAILGCVLVAGLVGFRLRQQRQLTAAPVAAA